MLMAECDVVIPAVSSRFMTSFSSLDVIISHVFYVIASLFVWANSMKYWQE